MVQYTRMDCTAIAGDYDPAYTDVSYDQSEFFPDTDKICHHLQYLQGQIHVSVLRLATTISADQAMYNTDPPVSSNQISAFLYVPLGAYGSSSFIQSDFSISVRAHGSVRILQYHPIRLQHFRTCPWERTDPPVSSNQIIGYIYHVMVISVCCPCILPHESVFSLDPSVSLCLGILSIQSQALSSAGRCYITRIKMRFF